MPWKPSFPGEVPTLGFAMIDWYTEMLGAPDCQEYEPLKLYLEQEDFILAWYSIDPDYGPRGRRKHMRGVVQRPRGWGKSPLLGAIGIGEALGPVVFDGWDAAGQPVGRPWKDFRKPIVHICAASDDQTGNTWDPILDMLHEDAPVHDHYSVTPYNSYIDLGYGKIERKTSSARSSKGNKPIFAVLDQTETWVPSNGGQKFADVIRSNVGKVGGTSLESPNAYTPGEGSVAEDSANYWQAIREGRALDESGLHYDHREAPPDTDLAEHDSLIEGLRMAYGDASNDPRGCVLHDPPCAPGHSDLERHVRTIWDPSFDVQTARSDYLNQITHASDSWVYDTSVKKCVQLWEENQDFIADGEAITLGFDGSRGRNRGKADATALIGCRVRDGALFEIKVWQAAQGERDWLPPMYEIDMFLKMAFDRWRVVGFYADPSGYSEHVARWESPKMYGRKLRVKATQNNPIAAWPRGKDSRVTEYCRRLKQAIDNTAIPIQGDAPYLLKHLTNARMRKTNVGYLLYKAYPDSPDKIDAAYAAVMAYKARTDALSQGITGITKPAASSSHAGRCTVS